MQQSSSSHIRTSCGKLFSIIAIACQYMPQSDNLHDTRQICYSLGGRITYNLRLSYGLRGLGVVWGAVHSCIKNMKQWDLREPIRRLLMTTSFMTNDSWVKYKNLALVESSILRYITIFSAPRYLHSSNPGTRMLQPSSDIGNACLITTQILSISTNPN